MKKYLSKNGIKIGIIVIVFAILVAIISGIFGGKATLMQNVNGFFRRPVQKAAQSLAETLENVYGYMFEYDSLKAENEDLKNQLEEAKEEARQNSETEKENERLTKLLGFSEDHSDIEMDSARVIGRSTSNWASTFTISKGKSAGFKVGDPVINESGALVGHISKLGKNWSTVTTVIDASAKISAIATDSGSTGMIIGDYDLMLDGKTKITYLPNDSQIFEGDTVVTSGSGGAYPYGLVIGTISSVENEAGGQVEYGVIKPIVDVDSLSQVFVITDFDVVS